MFHVAKQDHMGCAIATAAMIAGLTYEQAAGRCLNWSPAEVRYDHRLRQLLAELTPTAWESTELWRPYQVRDFPLPDWPVPLFLRDSWRRPRYGQWVAASGTLIHDPGLNLAFSVAEYPRRDWVVASLLEPARPALLRRGESRTRVALVLQELAAEMSEWSSPGAC
jgi:hypothetical protein